MGCGASRVASHPNDARHEPIRTAASAPDTQKTRQEIAAGPQLAAAELELSSGAQQLRSLRFALHDRVAAAKEGGSAIKEGGTKIIEAAAKLMSSERWSRAFSRRRSSPSLTEEQVAVVRLQAQIRARQARQKLQRMVKHTTNVKIQRDRDTVCRTLRFVHTITRQGPLIAADESRIGT
jgi:hypothetical protein